MWGRSSPRTDPSNLDCRVGRSFTSLLPSFAGFVGLAVLLGCHKHDAPGVEPLRVAAAADLSFAFREVGAAFEKETGEPVAFSFGATGLLEKQIAEGAPFDAFAAANTSFVDDAVASGACLADTKTTYATGHLAIFTTNESGLQPRALSDLADGRYKKIAIANADHAPYGKAAKQALERAGAWSQVQPRIVYGENVQQALQFAQSGNADAAIVALSLANVTPGHSSPVPRSCTSPSCKRPSSARTGKPAPPGERGS